MVAYNRYEKQKYYTAPSRWFYTAAVITYFGLLYLVAVVGTHIGKLLHVFQNL